VPLLVFSIKRRGEILFAVEQSLVDIIAVNAVAVAAIKRDIRASCAVELRVTPVVGLNM
jgi:hypothetical protein